MSVEISDVDWDVLNLTTPGGVNEDDIAYTINAYREEGRSDEEIQDVLNQAIERNRPTYDDIMRRVKEPNVKLERMKKRQEIMDTYIAPVMEGLGAVGHTGGRFLNTMTLGGSDAAAAVIDKAAGYVGIQTNLVKYIDEANQRWPIPTMVGDIGGLFAGLPKAVIEGATKIGTKLVGPAKTALGKAVKGGAVGAASNLAVQAGMEIQKTAEKIAGTREAETEKEFYDRVTGETMWSAGLGVATGALMGPAGMIGTKTKEAAEKVKKLPSQIGQAIKNTIDADAKAIVLAGGEDVVKGAQAAFQEALVSGAPVDEAESVFWREIMAHNKPQNQEHIKRLIRTNPEFARYMRQQMASAGQIVDDTVSALTKPQLGEYAHQMKKSLYGENYINKMGSTDFDNTKEGLSQLLGTDDGGAMYKAREQALGHAKEVVAADKEVQAMVFDEFSQLANNLRNNGEGVYQGMLGKVEVGTMRSYAGSQEAEEANNAFQEWLMGRQQNGIVTSPQQAEQQRRAFDRMGAQRYFDRKMTMGTSDIDDINDIKTFFAEQAPSDVTAGQKTAMGAFDEGINKNIYDKLDQGLYETNQAYRYTKKMQDMHQFGYNFDPDKEMVALDRALQNTTDAEFAASKLAAFKMGWTAKLQDAAVAGDSNKFEKLAASMTRGPLSKYFSKQEVGEIIDQVRPHIETKFYIEQNLKAARGVAELTHEEVQLARTITSAGIGARGAFLNSITTIAANYKYGPKTAKALMSLAQNPTLDNFNKVVKTAKDATEKRALMKVIEAAFNQTKLQLAEEAAITKEARDAND